VIDPAGGATYIEWLTDQIAANSWQIFQAIEAQGGMLACLENGSVQQSVATVCKAKFHNIRRRKDKIVGTNMYPDIKGKKLAIQPVKSAGSCQHQAAGTGQAGGREPFAPATLIEQAITAAGNGATTTQIARSCGFHAPASSLTVTPLTPHRAAEQYEALRDASAAFAAKSGAAPAILQLNIGPSGRYRLRADWTASFFEAAGFAIDGTRDFSNIDEALNALGASSANIAVITSDDTTYQTTVAPLAAALKAAKPGVTLLVAGAPGDHEAVWRAAGVDDFVNVRSNNYELNQQLLTKAGVL
jgi:methylmalonyl-CoA mutase